MGTVFALSYEGLQDKQDRHLFVCTSSSNPLTKVQGKEEEVIIHSQYVWSDACVDLVPSLIGSYLSPRGEKKIEGGSTG